MFMIDIPSCGHNHSIHSFYIPTLFLETINSESGGGVYTEAVPPSESFEIKHLIIVEIAPAQFQEIKNP